MRSVFLVLALSVFSLTTFAQNYNRFNIHNYIFAADSIAGFDEVAAKAAALSEGYLGEEFKVKMWRQKRSYVNAKYGIEAAKAINVPVNPAMIVPACTNEDFEGSPAGSITSSTQVLGWTVTQGFVGIPYSSCNLPLMTNQPAECQMINCGPTGTVDPIIGGCYPIYSVFGTNSNTGNSVNPWLSQMKGDQVIRINTNGTSSPNNYSITKLSKTYAVTASSSLFQFAFISVYSTGHTCCSAGAFQIQLTNASANTVIACPNFSLTAPSAACPATNTAIQFYNCGGACLSFTGTGTYIFNKWQVYSFDLSAYIGQNITIDFLSSDCDASGHFSYSYIDTQCGPMEITSNGNSFPASASNITVSACGAGSATITAPPGMGPYSWSSSSISLPPGMTVPSMTNNILVTNQVGQVQLLMNPAIACTPINKTITIVAGSAPSTISVSGGTAICGSGATTLIASGAPSYLWSNGATTNSIVVSPATTTVYTVGSGVSNPCNFPASITVSVMPQPTLNIAGTPTMCSGTSETFTLSGANSFSLNSVACSSLVSLQPTTTSNYVFSGSNLTGCDDTQTLTLVVTPSNTITVSGNTLICGNASATLTASGAISYSWSNGATLNPIVVTPTTVTVFSVNDIAPTLCSFPATIMVTPSPQLTLGIVGTNSVCIGTSATFTLSGGISYSLNSVVCNSIVNVQPTVTTNYVFEGQGSLGCIDGQTVNLIVNPNCADVWPGDANSDGIANNLDVLEVGIHYGQGGSARTVISNNWQTYECNNWVGTITNGKNVNHSDCNGSGLINASDTTAIWLNYNNTHQFKTNSSANTGGQINIVPDQAFVYSGQWGTASVYLGDAVSPVNSINGTAFTISYDQMYIQPDSVYMTYPVSFLNTGGDNLNFSKSYFSNGKMHCATTHTLSSNVSGNGAIAVFHFKVHPLLSYDTICRFEIQSAFKSETSGIILPLIPGSDSTTHIGFPLGVKSIQKENDFMIFPNPTNNLLTIKNSKEIRRVEVMSSTGQILISEIAKGNSCQLKLDAFPEGIYLLKIFDSENTVMVKKIIVKK
jgi:hypothetical protein